LTVSTPCQRRPTAAGETRDFRTNHCAHSFACLLTWILRLSAQNPATVTNGGISQYTDGMSKSQRVAGTVGDITHEPGPWRSGFVWLIKTLYASVLERRLSVAARSFTYSGRRRKKSSLQSCLKSESRCRRRHRRSSSEGRRRGFFVFFGRCVIASRLSLLRFFCRSPELVMDGADGARSLSAKPATKSCLRCRRGCRCRRGTPLRKSRRCAVEDVLASSPTRCRFSAGAVS